MVRGGRIDEARWLLAVDSLLKMSVKKRVLHVQLANRPRAGSSDAQNSPNCRQFDNWAERLVVVDAMLQGEAVDDPACLVASESAIRVVLVLEDPLARYDVGTRRTWN